MVDVDTVTGGSNKQERGIIFVTIHDEREEGYGRNPRSALMIQKLGDMGFLVIVLEVNELERISPDPNQEVVSLFDLDYGVNRWSPCQKTATGVPEWTRKLSTNYCIALGKKCECERVVTAEARHIANMFLRNGNGRVPWGPSPAPKREKKVRRAWRRPPSNHPSHPWLKRK